MSDANATIVGFVISFSILMGYALWLAVEWRRATQIAGARNRTAGTRSTHPRPTESVARELKPTTRIKTS